MLPVEEFSLCRRLLNTDHVSRGAGSDGGRNIWLWECAAMARRGRNRDLDPELRYWELLSQGVGPIEVCRLVGVDDHPKVGQ